MFIFLIAVGILLTIFGFTYSRNSSVHRLRAIQDGGVTSTIRLPAFVHRTASIHHRGTGCEGDGGFVASLSHHSVETPEGAGLRRADEPLSDEVCRLERRIIEQKIRDANQLGLFTESMWPGGLWEDRKDSTVNADRTLNTTERAKLVHQKISHTIYNMIQYETFKETVPRSHQELDEVTIAMEENAMPINMTNKEGVNIAEDGEKNSQINDKHIIQSK